MDLRFSGHSHWNDTAKKKTKKKQKKKTKHILTEDPKMISAVFFKMTGYPSFELTEAK